MGGTARAGCCGGGARMPCTTQPAPLRRCRSISQVWRGRRQPAGGAAVQQQGTAGAALCRAHAAPPPPASPNRQPVGPRLPPPLRPHPQVTLQQAWFNAERGRKPQSFAAAAAEAHAFDATGGGANCDFCSWQRLTAEDTWGRWGCNRTLGVGSCVGPCRRHAAVHLTLPRLHAAGSRGPTPSPPPTSSNMCSPRKVRRAGTGGTRRAAGGAGQVLLRTGAVDGPAAAAPESSQLRLRLPRPCRRLQVWCCSSTTTPFSSAWSSCGIWWM